MFYGDGQKPLFEAVETLHQMVEDELATHQVQFAPLGAIRKFIQQVRGKVQSNEQATCYAYPEIEREIGC